MRKLQGEINKSTIKTGDFNTPPRLIGKTTGQKISRDIEDLKNTINHLEVLDICRILHPTTVYYALYLITNERFTKINYVYPHHKASLNRI